MKKIVLATIVLCATYNLFCQNAVSYTASVTDDIYSNLYIRNNEYWLELLYLKDDKSHSLIISQGNFTSNTQYLDGLDSQSKFQLKFKKKYDPIIRRNVLILAEGFSGLCNISFYEDSEGESVEIFSSGFKKIDYNFQRCNFAIGSYSSSNGELRLILKENKSFEYMFANYAFMQGEYIVSQDRIALYDNKLNRKLIFKLRKNAIIETLTHYNVFTILTLEQISPTAPTDLK